MNDYGYCYFNLKVTPNLSLSAVVFGLEFTQEKLTKVTRIFFIRTVGKTLETLHSKIEFFFSLRVSPLNIVMDCRYFISLRPFMLLSQS